MKTRILLVTIVAALVAACAGATPTPYSTPTPVSTPKPEVLTPTTAATTTAEATPTAAADSSPSPTATLPPVVGPDPSYRMAVFYYPWYGNPAVDGEWVHWEEPNFRPPLDISSDYYPVLGAYSSVDPSVVAQHFFWLREAEVGVIISSWWGKQSPEDQAVPVLLELAERYGIKVAFHIEPYGGRTADRLVDDVEYIYARYGDHPAFCRTTASSRWSPDDRLKGLFFVWLIGFPDTESNAVEASYWREAIDAIHASPDGGLVIANTTEGDWIDGGHFDGLYNYATLHLDQSGGFSWAQSLPPGAWYVPSVIPGFSAQRIGYPDDTYVPRQDGATYDAQWEAALGVRVEPEMVTITSFNEWHEGTQIEPAAVDVTNDRAHTYTDYSPLPAEGYLALTRQWVDRFLSSTWPTTYRARIKITTTSDWTTFGLVKGASWLRPSLISASGEATHAWLEGDRFLLMQPLNRAEAGGRVEMLVDVFFVDPDPEGMLVFEIERGHLGSTQVELSNYLGSEPVVIETFSWDGINPDERNTLTVQTPAAGLLGSAP